MGRIILSILSLIIPLSCISQPIEDGNFRKSELVELVRLDPDFKLDIKYATDQNFIGQAVYTEARAFLQKPAAEALLKASKELKELGYGIIVFDGYRPWSVTKLFWDLSPEDKKAFVADPKDGSRHNRGCAIDLSLYELQTGLEVEMPSGYDEMNETAHPNYKGGSEEERKNRDLLRTVMEKYGFTVYENEWWHFDYKDWREYRILDIPFSEIKN